MITINLIGCGRLGKTLMRLITALPHYSLQTNEHASRDMSKLPLADLHIITVPDDKIISVAAELCRYQHNTTLMHCSGSLPANIMNPDNRRDIKTVSVHPARSFTDPIQGAANFAGTLCTVEGDIDAMRLVSELFSAFSAKLYPILAKDKPAYHAANCIAANYLVTLADAACQQFAEAGLEPVVSKAMTEQLMQSVLDNLKSKATCREALTGPIARGDIQTIQQHLQHLKPNLDNIYRQLGLQTIRANEAESGEKEKLKSLLKNSL